MRFTDPTGLDIGSPSDVGNPGHIGYDNGGSSVVPCPVKGGLPSISPGSYKTKDKDGNDIWLNGYYIDGVFVPSDEYSGYSYFIEYWLNLSRDEYTAEQLINALTFAVFLHGTDAIPAGFDLKDWKGRISDNTALQLIMMTVDQYVNELEESKAGFVQLLSNTILGLKYERYCKDNEHNWAKPEFVKDIMTIALYWNFIHPNSYVSFGDLSLREGGRFRPHSTHKTGDDVDLVLVWDGKNITNYKSRWNNVYLFDSFYHSDGRLIIQEFVNVINSSFPNKFKEIIWYDSRITGLYYKVYQNNARTMKLKYDHSDHIHLGY